MKNPIFHYSLNTVMVRISWKNLDAEFDIRSKSGYLAALDPRSHQMLNLITCRIPDTKGQDIQSISKFKNITI